MKEKISFVFLFAFFAFSNCQDVVEQKCSKACETFVNCSEQALKQKFPEEIKRQGRISCMDGCTTHNSDILQCYDEEGDSCKGFGGCLKQIDTLE